MANTLVGKLFSLHPTVEMVRKWVKDKWKLKESVSVSAMPGALFLFKFIAEEDVALVLFGCWSYGRNNLSLCRWKAGFDLAFDLQKTAPVWVRFPGLPLEYWDESIFKWIGNSLGHFVGVDEITKTKSCLVYARFRVQATVSMNLPNFISLKSRLGSWTQSLVYENATLFCQKCRKTGHYISQCKAPTPLPLKLKGPTLDESPVPNVPPIHNGPIVGHVVAPTSGPDLPPPVVEDPVMEEYPFAKSIINLLKSPAKNVDEASKSTLKEQCISLMASLVSPVDQLEDGEGPHSCLGDDSLPDGVISSRSALGYPLSWCSASSNGSMTPVNEGWITQRHKTRNAKPDVGLDLKAG
ncbi:uncharacterized protein LOC131049493 [Cryptomeria japonica]|uniref:uncharacterized protein LOC131049493 n=1 Tax=Cryptomeria japonica TaxID=3369 RepID=UPI0025ABD30C|nr:uncharacterized protein LOC131049493 [Cryptomeria japonica]